MVQIALRYGNTEYNNKKYPLRHSPEMEALHSLYSYKTTNGNGDVHFSNSNASN